MRRTPFAAFLLGLAVFTVFARPLTAQHTTASSLAFNERSVEIDGYLQRGQELEGQRRWGEALAHYEQGLRQYPETNSLEKRFEMARLHYDLGRRYADRSFSERVSHMPVEKALELYQQVLLKIQTHYVEQPSWQDLVARGTADLQTALTEPIFVERNVPGVNAAAIEGFRRELNETLAQRSVASRNDARDSVVAAANLAQQRLGLTPTVVVLEYLCGATNSLDPYSTFLTPDQLSEVYSQIDGNFVGLGVELKAQDGSLAIVRVIPGSPAEQAGVRGATASAPWTAAPQTATRPTRPPICCKAPKAPSVRSWSPRRARPSDRSLFAASGSKCPASIRCISLTLNRAWDICG